MNIIFLLVAAVCFFYALIKKPEIIAVFLFTLIIARINFDLKGLPLNTRAIVTLALFGRVMLEKEVQARYPSFMGVPNIKIFTVFLVYIMFIAFPQGQFKIDIIKEGISALLVTYCMYHFYFKHYNADQLKTAMIISGVICFADLAYTYIVYGSFPIHRIYFNFVGMGDITDDELDDLTNWNFFGQTCGMAFVYVFCDYVKNKTARNKYSLWLLPIMFLGVLMSTSRSSLLAAVLISILVVLSSLNYKDQKKKARRIGVFFVGAIVGGIVLFGIFGQYLNLDSKFIDESINRLSQEPIAIVKRALGQPYNIHDLGSMDWREESSENAYKAYLNMGFVEQLFGIGVGGFEYRNLGHGYNAHNATLLLLIENGMVGFFIYFLLVGGTMIQSIMKKNFSPSLATVGFILIYGLGQNREWTGIATYLFVISMVAELQLLRVQRQEQQSALLAERKAYHLSGN